MNDENKRKLDSYDYSDAFDKRQIGNWLMLKNQNNREDMEVYAEAQKRGII